MSSRKSCGQGDGSFVLTRWETKGPSPCLPAQTERDSIRQRQAEGIAAAKAKGKHLGRKAKPLPVGFIEKCQECQCGVITTHEAASALSMSHTTFYCHFTSYTRKKPVPDGRLFKTDMV